MDEIFAVLGCYATLICNCRSTLPNIPRGRGSHLHRGKNLKSCINVDLKASMVWRCERFRLAEEKVNMRGVVSTVMNIAMYKLVFIYQLDAQFLYSVIYVLH
jgi:hypothetical protein